MAKLTIVGAGNVGAQAAFYGALKGIKEIILIDVVDGMPQGKALDIQEAMPIHGMDVSVNGTNDYADTKDSDVVVITAGIARKPGMSRDDLINVNAGIMKAVVPNVVKYSPNTILIVVSNPLDAMVHLAYKLSGFPKNRVIGMAGVLDSARFRAFLAMETGEPVKNIEAMVLGTHGDLMVPLIEHCRINGKSIKEFMGKEEINDIVKRVRDGGAEIVALLKTGSAFFAPGLSIIEMVDSIINDRKKVLPCAAMLNGEYENSGAFAGVPVKLGKGGVEEIVHIKLSKEEQEAFNLSVAHIKELVKNI